MTGRGTVRFAALRAAVPAPTGRTGRRSAFPCLRGVMLGGVRAERGVMTGRGTVRFAALGAAVPAPAGRTGQRS